MSLGPEHKETLKRLAALTGLLASSLALVKLGAPVVLLAAVAVAGLMFVFRLQRGAPEYQPSSLIARTTTLLFAAIGYAIGLLIPMGRIEFVPGGLSLALLCFVVLGSVELRLLGRILSPTSTVAILSGNRFPFFSLGVAMAIVLSSS